LDRFQTHTWLSLVGGISDNGPGMMEGIFKIVFGYVGMVDSGKKVGDEFELAVQPRRLLVAGRNPIKVMREEVAAPVAQESVLANLVEYLHHCPFGLAAIAKVFLLFGSRHLV
jgi:hypothetical protein